MCIIRNVKEIRQEQTKEKLKYSSEKFETTVKSPTYITEEYREKLAREKKAFKDIVLYVKKYSDIYLYFVYSKTNGSLFTDTPSTHTWEN